MKRLLLTLCCTLATALFADTWTDPETNITWTYTLSNGNASLGGGNDSTPAVPTSYAGPLTIPATLNGSPVVALNNDAFYYCSALTSIVIPASVTAIGDSAFCYCTSLTSVVIPEGVTSIGNYVFDGCSSLTSVTIPEGITSIGNVMFWGCSSLTSVTIPNSVTSIGNQAFYGCSALASVVIPSSVTSIGGWAFEDCSALTAVVIPEGVTSIGNGAFAGCTSVKTLSIAATVSAMPVNALPSFNSLESIRVAEGSPLYWTENNILYNAGKTVLYRVAAKSAVGEVVIPKGVTAIEASAFYNCSALISVVIPEGVTSIGARAFSNCSALTSIVIPEGVTSIGDYTFDYCSALTSVVIPSSVTSIGDSAFRDCSALTSVVIPEGVTAIGDYTFYNCSALTSVVIPEGVTTIEEYAFFDCSSLTSVVIPSSVTTIGHWAFGRCYALRSVTFLGDVPEGWEYVDLSDWGKIHFSQAYAGKWNAVLSAARRGTLVDLISKAGVTVSAEMTTPKTMRVTYSVESTQPTVKVRAVAWKDGVRSFANIVPVKTTAAGSPEEVPNGGEVTTGVEHTFVWQVSADWATDLDKVALEILVAEGTLLPQEKITIPALGEHPAMTLTRNSLEPWHLFDALVWCYAEEDDTLTVTDGVVKVNGTQVANGVSLSAGDNTALLNYLYGKMGYRVLAGEDLAWAKAATRLELADSGLDQVSVKITEE